MQKLTENVYAIYRFFGYLNQYVIVNDEVITVVDMMLGKPDVDNLEQELKTHGWSLDDVQHLLITHAHPDHIGGLEAFQERSNATTYAHRLDAQVIRGETDSAVANPDELGWFNRMLSQQISQRAQPEPARVDVDLGDGDVLDTVLDGLQVIHLPGHSHGQVGFYIPHQKLLIGGDVMMRFFGSLWMPIRSVSPDWTAVKQSIRRVAELDVEILCLGHGKPIFDANTVIRHFADRITD